MMSIARLYNALIVALFTVPCQQIPRAKNAPSPIIIFNKERHAIDVVVYNEQKLAHGINILFGDLEKAIANPQSREHFSTIIKHLQAFQTIDPQDIGQISFNPTDGDKLCILEDEQTFTFNLFSNFSSLPYYQFFEHNLNAIRPNTLKERCICFINSNKERMASYRIKHTLPKELDEELWPLPPVKGLLLRLDLSDKN